MQIDDLFNQQGQQVIADIQANISAAGKNVTGKTAQSLGFHVEQSGTKYKFTLTGWEFIYVLQTGRRPTPDKKPSREMISNLTAWTRGRGMNVSAVWAIATKINQEGTKLWQEGGRTDIIDPALDKFINETTNQILSNEAEEFRIKINDFKWQ